MATTALFFSVKDYGAVGDGSTDDTTSIQNAINACVTAGGGVVFFPFTGNFYAISGSLVTSVDGINPNAQIYFPLVLGSTSGNVSVKLLGEVPPHILYGGNSSYIRGIGGVVLKSTILGSGTKPKVLGSSFNSSGGGGVTNFNNIKITIENIEIKVRSKTTGTDIAPTMTAFGMGAIGAGLKIVDCVASTESALNGGSVEPTDPNVIGFDLPPRLNNAGGMGGNTLINCSAFGFYKGFTASDHANLTSISFSGCYYGVSFGTADNTVYGNRWTSTGCKYPIVFEGNTIVDLSHFYFEDNGAGWYALTTIFYAPSPVTVKGRIVYKSTNNTFSSSANFGNVQFISLDDNPTSLIDASSTSTFYAQTIRGKNGTNVGQAIYIMPKGTGASATNKATVDIFNTDFMADSTNYEDMIIRSIGTGGYIINTRQGGTGTTRPIAIQVDGTTKWTFQTNGSLALERTVTAGGTTGNQTINKQAGTVNIAAAGTTVTVTNSLVTTSSIVFGVVRTNDATALIKNIVPGSGSFVINMNAAVTAETSIGFWVVN